MPCQVCGALPQHPWETELCDACRPAARRQSRAALGDLPNRVRLLLLRNGYCTREQLARATDEELYALRHCGRTTVAQIRALIAAAPPAPKQPCPTCHGTGWVDDAPDA